MGIFNFVSKRSNEESQAAAAAAANEAELKRKVNQLLRSFARKVYLAEDILLSIKILRS